MQVGPIGYGKEEEKAFLKSILLGLLSGLPLGFLLTSQIGFPQYSHDFVNRFVGSIILLGSIESVSALISTVLCLLYLEKGKMLHSWRDAARVIWALFIFFPVFSIYIALVVSTFVFPAYDATYWLSPVRQYWLGALLFLPFLFLFMLICLPDQKPRKIANQAWLIIKREKAIPRLKARSVIVSLLILAWLISIFLPLPNIAIVNLALIGSGLLVVAYLAKQRYRMKKK